MIANRDALRDKAYAAKLQGMDLAANRRPDKVAQGKIALLRALLKSPDGTATIDDSTADLAAEFRDGGKWRGAVCRSLATPGLIRRVDAVKSERPSRHCGYVTRWRLVDRHKAQIALSRFVAAQDCRVLMGNELPKPSPLKSETPLGTTSDVSVQQSFPAF